MNVKILHFLLKTLKILLMTVCCSHSLLVFGYHHAMTQDMYWLEQAGSPTNAGEPLQAGAEKTCLFKSWGSSMCWSCWCGCSRFPWLYQFWPPCKETGTFRDVGWLLTPRAAVCWTLSVCPRNMALSLPVTSLGRQLATARFQSCI